VLAQTWAEILGVDRVGVLDDFFALGGHSLQAARVTSRIERALRTPTSIRQLFEHPTVARLAAAIRASSAEPGLVDAIAAVVLQVRALTPAQRAARLRGTEGDLR
jgi:Phosphopantetheine attachment site